MSDTKLTPDQYVAEAAAAAIDGQIFRLQQERAQLLLAPDRIAEIDAILAAFQPEKARLDPRRLPKVAIGAGPIDSPVEQPVKSGS